ncbi:MAG: hypothetical protein A3C30_02825 [Candidatus Levybacteria bacterium RIFCSPHIGHO2_02_FULL_40_18]|nr:MAG: hypothetical protein A2869_05155 [Candidatus Levybacteria bacterium RIFCSPHIGHO2_01_FULL_40_58]OGH26909.1 MAG: hypothetical protein A3C30_02825 [Candidatus Levybacteria bacterium RIFCSPHIGHO2_02_FULL_40_18]OGH32031.1 MAG: hypothetical protein A3E43_03805 [Candidatus Levybacteria bacterium RIFCSPHIGHO2_12_FULL_40_31]OGH40847.1 MAG: hypothetical protein A2894_04595 [Candidatus Levybacteria bacterium RIFCSPLOWO2_01_FULL_40_64]OGH48703.1 MAG: hypothetical protein A3I54_03525 [Candidatus Lev
MTIIIFSALLSLAVFLEGIGIPYDRKIPLYLLLSLPYVLFILNRKWKIELPRTLKILFGGFLFFSLVSTLLSPNVRTSIEYLFLYTSAFLFFVYIINNKEQIERFMLPLIFAFSALFVIYSLALPALIRTFPFLEPQFGYQVVFSKFFSHNHLGDFLLLPLVMLFYYLLSNRNSTNNRSIIYYLLSIILFLPYFLFSFSRSAYLALFLTLVLMVAGLVRTKMFKFSLPAVILLVFSLLLPLLFIFSVVQRYDYSLSSRISYLLTNRYGLEYKEESGNRLEYLSQSFLSIRKNPLFGTGPGNFIEASNKFKGNYSTPTETAHNVFLEMLVENGVLAGIVFVFLIFELLRRSQRNVYFYMALGLLINFQTDYTYRIYFLFVLFFILLGLAYKEGSIDDRL